MTACAELVHLAGMERFLPTAAMTSCPWKNRFWSWLVTTVTEDGMTKADGRWGAAILSDWTTATRCCWSGDGGRSANAAWLTLTSVSHTHDITQTQTVAQIKSCHYSLPSPQISTLLTSIEAGSILVCYSKGPVDLEIDRVERIDSTRLKIDRLDQSTRL